MNQTGHVDGLLFSVSLELISYDGPQTLFLLSFIVNVQGQQHLINISSIHVVDSIFN